jgi:hypothetical protein
MGYGKAPNVFPTSDFPFPSCHLGPHAGGDGGVHAGSVWSLARLKIEFKTIGNIRAVSRSHNARSRSLLSPSAFDSADKAAVCSRLSSRSRRRAREKADREEKRRRTPTPLFARRSALGRRRRIRERPGTDPRFRVAGVAPALAAPRGPRWADRGVARCVAPPTPARSARRAAAARRSGDTPGHRVRTFGASTRPTDTHPHGMTWRPSCPRRPRPFAMPPQPRPPHRVT